jgi:hypothetical protein
MKEATPGEQWERLQAEYHKAVQSSYPNPERHGCPAADALQDLAVRSARHEDIEGDEHWKHVVHCGPCYREYLDLRVACCIGEDASPRRESR